MKLLDLIKRYRALSKDKKEPYLLDDEMAGIYANEAQMEAARRGRLLMDSTTPEVCEIVTVVGQAEYEIDPRVIYIRRIKPVSQVRPLSKVDLRDLDDCVPGWEDRDDATPLCWTPIDDHKISLIPPPDTVDTLRLTVVREPLVAMVLDDATAAPPVVAVDCELRGRHAEKLVEWMLYRVYSNSDTELTDLQRADKHLAAFEAEFGPPTSAVNETWITRRHGFDDGEGLF